MSAGRRPPLTPAQQALLAEIEEAGILYVRSDSAFGRTVRALVNKRYVYVSEPDYSRTPRPGYSVIDK